MLPSTWCITELLVVLVTVVVDACFPLIAAYPNARRVTKAVSRCRFLGFQFLVFRFSPNFHRLQRLRCAPLRYYPRTVAPTTIAQSPTREKEKLFLAPRPSSSPKPQPLRLPLQEKIFFLFFLTRWTVLNPIAIHRPFLHQSIYSNPAPPSKPSPTHRCNHVPGRRFCSRCYSHQQ